MYFTHGAADETVVYQSLHKTYLYIVKILYFDISINNTGGQKLYSNVIELFNIWKERELKQNLQAIQYGRKNLEKGASCKTVK